MPKWQVGHVVLSSSPKIYRSNVMNGAGWIRTGWIMWCHCSVWWKMGGGTTPQHRIVRHDVTLITNDWKTPPVPWRPIFWMCVIQRLVMCHVYIYWVRTNWWNVLLLQTLAKEWNRMSDTRTFRRSFMVEFGKLPQHTQVFGFENSCIEWIFVVHMCISVNRLDLYFPFALIHDSTFY